MESPVVDDQLATAPAVVDGDDGAYDGGSGGPMQLHLHFDNIAFLPTAAQARAFVDAIEPELGRRLGRTSTSVGYGLGGN